MRTVEQVSRLLSRKRKRQPETSLFQNLSVPSSPTLVVCEDAYVQRLRVMQNYWARLDGEAKALMCVFLQDKACILEDARARGTDGNLRQHSGFLWSSLYALSPVLCQRLLLYTGGNVTMVRIREFISRLENERERNVISTALWYVAEAVRFGECNNSEKAQKLEAHFRTSLCQTWICFYGKPPRIDGATKACTHAVFSSTSFRLKNDITSPTRHLSVATTSSIIRCEVRTTIKMINLRICFFPGMPTTIDDIILDLVDSRLELESALAACFPVVLCPIISSYCKAVRRTVAIPLQRHAESTVCLLDT